MYLVSNKRIIPLFFKAIYLATIFFLVYFLLSYGKSVFSFGLTRLGDKFGDINDIAIFNGIGFTFSLYFLFFSKKVLIKSINAVFLVLFIIVILSSGSKIAYLFIPVTTILTIVCRNGKNRWWLSLIMVSAIVITIFVVLNIPSLSFIKNKIVTMLLSVFGDESSSGSSVDYSTIHRFDMFVIGMELFLRSPAFGYGINGYRLFGGYSTGWSHNHYSEMLSAVGLVGFSLYSFPFVLTLFKSIKTKNYGATILMFFFIVVSISIVLTGEKLFAFIIGVAYASCRTDEISHSMLKHGFSEITI